MKFMLLLHDDEAAWLNLSESEQSEVVSSHMAYSEALTRAGALVGGEPLDAAATAKIVRADAVHDGPYGDTKEQLGGFYIVDVPDMEAAIDWARRCPVSPAGAVEVRPVPDYAD